MTKSLGWPTSSILHVTYLGMCETSRVDGIYCSDVRRSPPLAGPLTGPAVVLGFVTQLFTTY